MSLNKISINNKEIIGVDDEPFAESDNLIKSKGVFENTPSLKLDNSSSLLNIGDEQGNVILEFNNGHLKTKEFNSNDALITQYDNSSNELNVGDINGEVIAKFVNGHIKTKNFDSETIGRKIAYHSDWRRFKIKTNISPYGIYNNSQGETSTIEPDNLS